MGRLAHQFAVASEHVVADVIEVEALPELAAAYSVTSVPKALFNGTVELLGTQSEASFLEALSTALAE